ncbi:hypothetical protein JOC54_000756 [Alkalihalobacillus xiaoxiensis]|uniref:TcaA protein NTF2-like domain-containing protein n=1 Tax=Shouchella xiaoxiensis TaxID=766895 RepID=A0ABS2SRR7_9BACI|nr:hypothetical protein [Shouchella xiaoxiensis]MBM7837525.1 hypothetical protein [Shouchella xiaoxiensis]
MRQVIVSICLMFLIVTLASCGPSEPDHLEAVTDEPLVEEITAFVQAYKQAMHLAINENKTDELEETYLIPNTSFYHALHRLREDLQKAGSQKNLVSLEVNDVWFDPEEKDYFADADEHVQVLTGDEVEDIERSVRFHIVKGSDDTFRLYTIIDRTNKNE